MGGTVVLVASLAAVAAGGGTVALSLRLDSAPRVLLAAYVIGWAGLVVAVALLSVPGWLGRVTLAVVLAAAGLLGVAAWLARGGQRVPTVRPAIREPLADPLLRLLALAVALGGAYLTALAFATTPNDWDGLTYHETRPLLWEQQGGIGYVSDGNDPRLNGNPPVGEIGLYLAMLLPRSDQFAALPQYVALLTCVIAVALLGRRIGRSRPEAAYGALVFASLPVVFLQGAAIQNDLIVASFLLSATLFLVGSRDAELALGSISLGLALGTKFTAILALPLIIAIVVVGTERGRRNRALAACVGGLLLGAPWYVLNLAETGSLDGGLGESTGQVAARSTAETISTLRALAFDVVDASGIWRSELLVPVIVGGILVGAGMLPGVRIRRPTARELVVAGIVVAGVTPMLYAFEWFAREVWQRVWLEIGQEQIALAHSDAWKVQSRPDTSLSWYGAAGAAVIIAGGIAALVRVLRARERPVVLLFAAAPGILVAIFALTIVYDPWRGRLLVFGVGLACAAWGWTLRVRWLAVGITALCATTVVLTLVHSQTKPSGVGFFESPIAESIWARGRIDALSVIRNYDGTPGVLRAVEGAVSADAEVAIATPVDTFLAPLAGPRFSRVLRLVANGERVPATASWIVTRLPVSALGCSDAWSAEYVDLNHGWRMLRRVRSDDCATAVPL